MSGQVNPAIVIGLVVDLDDPDGIGRIKVEYPHLEDQQSYWARLVTPMAGKGRGLFMRPEVGDEVVVGWEYNDPRRAYILGSVWSKTDTPPSDDGKRTENNWRFIKSRSGHIIKLNDTTDSETIEIIDQKGSHKIIIDSAGDRIQVVCDSGDVEVSANGGSVKVEAAQSIELNAGQSMTLQASGSVTIKGATVNIN